MAVLRVRSLWGTCFIMSFTKCPVVVIAHGTMGHLTPPPPWVKLESSLLSSPHFACVWCMLRCFRIKTAQAVWLYIIHNLRFCGPRAWAQGQCVARCACLLPRLRLYEIILIDDGVDVRERLADGHTRQFSGCMGLSPTFLISNHYATESSHIVELFPGWREGISQTLIAVC